MHCSDEQLLAHLDGELHLLARHRVQRHLKSCWHCRTRFNACEQEIQRLTVAMDEWPFPPPEWNREAKQRLNWRLEEVEAGLVESPLRRNRRLVFPVAAAAAAVLFGCAGWFLWTGKVHPRLRAADVIAEVSRAEGTLYSQPVQQTFSVEIAELRPARQTVNARLEIWSDRGSGRFASRLSGPGGTLKHALWRPSADAEFVYRGAASSQVLKQRPHREETIALESLADYGLDPVQLEAAFVHWLEGRSWNPISFAADISQWTADDGSIASAEGMRSADGTPMIRITAQRKSRKMVAVLTVEVDSSSYRSRLQTIRFETPERAIEFRLSATAIQPIRRTEMNSGVFQPDLGVERDLRTTRPPLPKPEAPATPSTNEPSNNVIAVDPRAVEARFVLHQAGACVGEPVRVSEDAGATWVVRIGNEGGSYQSKLGLDYLLGALSDLRRGQLVPRDTGETQSVALRHAWEMKRLAEDFPARRIASLPPDSWQSLETMLRDHTAAVRRELEGFGFQHSAISKSRPQDPDWRASAAILFETLTHLSELRSGDSSESSINIIDRRLDNIVSAFLAESRRQDTAIKMK
jgi:hypothetical protein